MLQAGYEEKQIAMPTVEHHQEIPAITVKVDEGWSKRSHEHLFNANSGVGVMNKFCAVCSISQRRGIESLRHMCFKNWTGSSTSMEADIITSRFQLYENMHSLRYMNLMVHHPHYSAALQQGSRED